MLFGLVLFSLCVVSISAQGLTIESTFVNTYLAPSSQPGLVNQTTTWQQNTATFQCNQDNFYDNGLQIQSPNGTINYYAIECLPPLHAYDTELVGFVPAQGTLYTTQACQVTSLSAFNGQNFTNFNANTGSSNPAGRRLLGFGFGSLGTQFLTGGACAVTFGAISMLGTNCNADDGNIPSSQWIAQLQSFNNFIANTTAFDNDVTNSLGAQANVNSQVQTVLTQLNSKTTALANYTFTLNATVYALAVHDTMQFAAVNSQLQTIYTGFGLFGQQVQQQSAETIALQAFTISSFQAVLNTTNKIQANSAATNLANLHKFNTLTQLVKQLAVSVSQALLLTQMKAAITNGIYQNQAVATQNGEVFYVDPTQPGVAPATNFPTALLQVYWDVQYLNYITISGGQKTNHQYGLSYFCNADKYQNLGFPAVDYTDIPTLIGPMNCTNGGDSAALAKCLCWVKVSHKTCTPPTNFFWQQITSTSRAAYTLTPGSAMCTGAITAGANDGLLISNSTKIYSIYGQWCAQTLASFPQNQFQFLSYRIGFHNMIAQTPSSWITPVCSMDLTNIFETSQYISSLPFIIITSLTQAYAVMATDANAVLQYQQGLQPSYVTYTYLPFETLPDNNTYSCYRASIMGVSLRTKPVFVINPSAGNPVTTTVTSTAYDSPPTNCIGTQCDFGNVVNVEQTNNVAYSNPLQSILPAADSVIFDVLQPLGTPPATTNVYNAPFLAAATSGPLQSAAGQLTYMLQPVPAGFVLANVDLFSSNPWPATAMLNSIGAANYNSRVSAQYFNHENAAYTIDQTIVSINNLEECVVPTGQTSQWLCTLLANYNVNPLTNFLLGKFVVSPDLWTYIVTLNINMGEIIQRVYPGCPDLSFQQYGANQISFVLTNSLPTTVTTIVRLKSTSGLCQNPGDMTYDLQPKQIFTRTLPTCGTQTIQIFQLSSIQGLQSCGAAIPFVVNTTSQTVLQGPTAVFNQSFIQVQYITQTTGVILGAVQLMQTIIPYLDPANFNLTQQQKYAAINASLLAFINLALKLSTEQLLGNTSAVDIYNQYAPQLASFAQSYQVSSLATTLALNNLTKANQVFVNDVAITRHQFTLLNASGQDLIAKNNALIAAIQAIQDQNAGGYTCVGCPDIPLIYQLCCAVDNFGQFLANILLYGLIAGVVITLAYLIYRLVKQVQQKQRDDALAKERGDDRTLNYEQGKTHLDAEKAKENIPLTAPEGAENVGVSDAAPAAGQLRTSRGGWTNMPTGGGQMSGKMTRYTPLDVHHHS